VDGLRAGPPSGARSSFEPNLPRAGKPLVYRGALARFWSFLCGSRGAEERVLLGAPAYVEPPGAGRYTERARWALHEACGEARLLNHDCLGTEHLLLGLLDEGVTAHVLDHLDIDPVKVRSLVFMIAGTRRTPGDAPARLPWTPWAWQALVCAVAESSDRRHESVGVEHLWLGLLRTPEGVAGQVFANLGRPIDALRDEVLGLLGWQARPVRRPRQSGETWIKGVARQ
jgi:ATP-dependent Clp protease ATP-binding subunit ClpC